MKKYFLLILLMPYNPVLAQNSSPGELINAWVKCWNTYDLNDINRLFVNDSSVTYFSSERPGLIKGIDSLRRHHEHFGFVPGGKKSESRLWLTEIKYSREVVTATWHFQRPGSEEQKGPVTFILNPGASGYRIKHAHFSNDPQPR